MNSHRRKGVVGNGQKSYRALVKTTVKCKNIQRNSTDADNTIILYIPEPITYNSEYSLLNSDTRWDYSFGVNEDNVVIMIRHVAIIDDDYAEIRKMPEYCYDYETFVSLGGWMEYGTVSQVANEISPIIDKDFDYLFPELLNKDKNEDIHIIIDSAADLLVTECTGQEYLDIPVPVNYIVQNFVPSSGNNNCNRPLVDESFFEALSAFDTGVLKDKSCYITEDYVSTYNNSEISETLMYDTRIHKILSEKKWSDYCYKWTIKKKKERIRALEKHGLLEAYDSLKCFLQNHHHIRRIAQDVSVDCQTPYEIVEVDLRFGYKLTGFKIIEKGVLWKITTYERPIKENDCIRGMDDCYLMYTNDKTIEVASELDYRWYKGESHFTEQEYELYSNTYVEIASP